MSAKGRTLVRLHTGPVEPDPRFDRTIGLENLARLAKNPRSALSALLERRPISACAVDLRAVPKPFLVGMALRAFSRGSVSLTDERGRRCALTWPGITRLFSGLLGDYSRLPSLRRRVLEDVAELEALGPAPPLSGVKKPVAVVKPDLWLGTRVGGAVAHSAGLVNAFADLGYEPTYIAFEPNPIIRQDIEQYLLAPPRRFWNVPEAPLLAANQELLAAGGALSDDRFATVYQRVSAFHYGAALAARRSGVPLIVEYNGSEPWIARHWGAAFRNEDLALRIETAVLKAASRVVAVAEPLREDLEARGVEPARVVVQPNGADLDRFRPDIGGGARRKSLNIGAEDLVIGFIGSFGPWHGVPVLIEAFASLLRDEPGRSWRLLVIGDGPGRSDAERRAAHLGAAEAAVFTGAVAQAEAPSYLAACDVLVAPHVGNPDGSAFFGSPTKVFEYMAMGRCIVASDLGQIGSVLEDGETALLVPPGDSKALHRGLLEAGDPRLRERLGRAARHKAERHHGWEAAARAILGHKSLTEDEQASVSDQ